ncbi:MAG TPA: hypothetical protein VFQ13_00325 [Anaerolineales bacterium]|nr:hypothetical protein [Anaerolineales bacterium]
MKQRNILTVILLLVTMMIACNASAIQTVEVTRVVPQTVIATEPNPEGGFTTGTPVDVTILPALANVPSGIEPTPCFVESTEPSISWGYGVFPYEALCLNNFPTAPDSPGFTVTLTDPTGRTFSESFTYSQEEIIDSRGAKAGFIENGNGMDGFPATPGINMKLYMPASFSCGDWSVSANSQDGRINVAPTTLAMECQGPRLSVLSQLDTNPFISPAYNWDGPAFANNETFYVVGTTYSPNTAITVALYQDDPSAGTSENGFPLGTAKYAVSIVTDNTGNFQAPFTVGTATQRGAYYVIAAPTITPDIRLYHFGPRFSIK